jgi:hypothetical protein
MNQTQTKPAMQSLKQYQTVLKTLLPLQEEISNSFSYLDKPSLSFMVDDKKHFRVWLQQLRHITGKMTLLSTELNQQLSKGEDEKRTLNHFRTMIESLIKLHTEVTSSYANTTNLMEGRYLLEYVTKQLLEKLSADINEYRHQVNDFVFNCKEGVKSDIEQLALVINLEMGVGFTSFRHWLGARA